MPLYTILLVTLERIYKFQDDNASTRARKRARTYARTHALMDGHPENIMHPALSVLDGRRHSNRLLKRKCRLTFNFFVDRIAMQSIRCGLLLQK